MLSTEKKFVENSGCTQINKKTRYNKKCSNNLTGRVISLCITLWWLHFKHNSYKMQATKVTDYFQVPKETHRGKPGKKAVRLSLSQSFLHVLLILCILHRPYNEHDIYHSVRKSRRSNHKPNRLRHWFQFTTPIKIKSKPQVTKTASHWSTGRIRLLNFDHQTLWSRNIDPPHHRS